MKKSHIYLGICEALFGLLVWAVVWHLGGVKEAVQTGPARDFYELGVRVGKKHAADTGSRMPSAEEIDAEANETFNARKEGMARGSKDPFVKGFRDGFISAQLPIQTSPVALCSMC